MAFRYLTTVLVLSVLLLTACGRGPTSATQVDPDSVASPTPPSVEPSVTAPPVTPTVAAPSPTLAPAPMTVGLSPRLPEYYARPLLATLSRMESVPTQGLRRPVRLLDRVENAGVQVVLLPLAQAQHPIAERFYAVVAPFATVTDQVSLAEVQARWRDQGEGPIVWSSEDTAGLEALLGQPAAEPAPAAELLARLTAKPGSLGLLPFDRLDPRFKVLAVDGVNVLSSRLDPVAYPLAVALDVQGAAGGQIAQALQGVIDPVTNRDPGRLTTLIMTGVTAMSRMTAARMEQKGYTYPAEIISDTLRAADITHVSNEVPFLDGCRVDASLDNLVLCSDYPYWAALEAIGADIVGLSGNHVNDFGRDGARESIQFYRERSIPIYGSGLNLAEACAPLLWEHNGNRFAFFAALAYWPEYAWAAEDQPGACYFYDNHDTLVSAMAALRPRVDIIAVELQYFETYEPFPTQEQVTEFRDVREKGADIVTGVQSHVPQAMEPYGPGASPGSGATDNAGAANRPGIIVYGLGNLFFDQMWSWETRTELMARHTVYAGRLLSTEILTAVLEDYAQPRWATPEERVEILQRIFNATPARP